MKPGTRIAGRWVVDGPLPSDPEVDRFRVRAEGGEEAEGVAPAPHALLRAGVRDAFVASSPPDHPAALSILATDAVDGVPVRIREATAGTLDGARISAEDAVALIGWLAPAILAGGGAGLGELEASEIAIDRTGVARFAPFGVPRPRSVARTPRHRAPEGITSPEADLYGLGVTLYRAVTGAWPGEVWQPPSAFGASAAADAPIAALLSRDPAARRAGVEGLPASPTRVAIAPPAAQPPAAKASSPVKLTTPTSPPVRTSTATADIPPWVVLVPLAGQSPAALRAIAARSAVDPAAVTRAAARGATWCVDAVATEAEAGRLVSRLGAAGVTGARAAGTRAPKVIQFVLLAMICGAIALVSGFFFAGGALIFGVAAVAMLYFAAVNLRGMFDTANTRMALQERERAALPDSIEGRLRALRHRVQAADLPGIVLEDLRVQVAEVERRLDDARSAEAELAASGAAGLDDLRANAARELAEAEAGVAALDAALTRALTAGLEAPVTRSGVPASPSSAGASTQRPTVRTPE